MNQELKAVRVNYDSFYNYEKNLFKEYQFKFISEQPEDKDLQSRKIYVWVKDGTLYYTFLNEDKKIISKNIIDGRYTNNALFCEEESEENKKWVKLLESKGSNFKDIKNKVGNIVKFFLDNDELLSHENMEKKTQLASNKDNLYQAVNDRAKALTHYESDEKFVEFIQDNLRNKTWWLNSTLSSAFFSAMTEEARQLMIWSLTPTNKLQFQSSSAAKKSNNSPYHRLHYLSTGFHASSIVEMGDFPQLIKCSKPS